MAKVNCAVCNAEVGILKQIQLKDQSIICKNCANKTSLYFHPQERYIDHYNAHIKQLEDGAKLYKAYFEKNKDAKEFMSGKAVINKSAALMAFPTKRGGFLGFGAETQCVVYRIADLDICRLQIKNEKDSQGADVERCIAHFTFRNTRGLDHIQLNTNKIAFSHTKDYIGGIFNGAGLNFFEKQAQNMEAEKDFAANFAANFASSIKGAISGDEEAIKQTMNVVQEGVQESFYAKRKDLVAAADKAIKDVLG